MPYLLFLKKRQNLKLSSAANQVIGGVYEGQSKITEPYLITFELSKMDINLNDISLKLYVIYLIT